MPRIITIPDEWRDAIVVRIRDKHGVLGREAHSWLDDVLEKGDRSEHWEKVRPAAIEFARPVWDVIGPVISHLATTIGVTLTYHAQHVIAGTDQQSMVEHVDDPNGEKELGDYSTRFHRPIDPRTVPPMQQRDSVFWPDDDADV